MSFDNSLRERLADVLWQRLCAAHPQIYRGVRQPGNAHGTLFTVADEVIRQMEWARRQIIDRHYGSTDDDRAHVNESTPLTLAPEDWQP